MLCYIIVFGRNVGSAEKERLFNRPGRISQKVISTLARFAERAVGFNRVRNFPRAGPAFLPREKCAES